MWLVVRVSFYTVPRLLS